MFKKIIKLSTIAILATTAYSADADNDKLNKLEKKILKLEKKLSKTNKKLNQVKAHDAYDNIKFSIDFRNSVDFITIKDNNANTTETNDILSTRLYLDMASSPTDKIVFRGKFGINNVWGGHPGTGDSSFKSWQASSKADNNEFKLKEAYILYTADNDMTYSAGRRQSTGGFLANHRTNTKEATSPLAHVTNMEVDAMMIMFGESFTKAEGSFLKILYGRAHDPVHGVNSMYSEDGTLKTFTGATTTEKDKEVNIAGILGNIYDNGTYKLMGQRMMIINTKGRKIVDGTDANDIKSAPAGKACVTALSLEVNGLDMINEDSDFLADTIVFASIANTEYKPKDGYSLLGSTENKSGSSIWLGIKFPDMLSNSGKFGIEYNKGSQYWTPFTWAEDNMLGSKIAVRGHATEIYWNGIIGNNKNLTTQIKYQNIQHDYTPNQNCQGWVKPEAVDITASNLTFSIRYIY